MFEQNFYNKLVVVDKSEREMLRRALFRFQTVYRIKDHELGLLIIKDDSKSVGSHERGEHSS
jgi:hypothetical protein